jgi:hypothetical protein
MMLTETLCRRISTCREVMPSTTKKGRASSATGHSLPTSRRAEVREITLKTDDKRP